jgi:transposase
MTTLRYCKGCFAKQQKINALEEENARLKAQVRRQERTAKEGFFGASTPSSKVPVKAKALPDRQARRGGGRPGHSGHGRNALREDQADRVERVAAPDRCPHCRVRLVARGLRRRTVVDIEPVKAYTTVFLLERKRCPKCGRPFEGRPPGILPKGLYGNRLLAYVAAQHYLHGNTLGQIERQTGVGCGALVQALRHTADLFEGVMSRLVEEYRKAPVKHADETGWRTDGQNGYAWIFATRELSLFRFRKSRSAAVAAEVFGLKHLPGTLVVDRYHGYNKIRCNIEYCYSHLKRDVEGIQQDFPDNPEIAAFVESLVPAISQAMSLRTLALPRRQFLNQAATIKRRIMAIAHRQAKHPAIWRIQNIFRENAHRLYHWARDPTIPAENNLAERDLRPLVIARKISFGSQSEAGAHTREILMSILHTLKKRGRSPAAALQDALDQLARHPDLDPCPIFFLSQRPAPQRPLRN